MGLLLALGATFLTTLGLSAAPPTGQAARDTGRAVPSQPVRTIAIDRRLAAALGAAVGDTVMIAAEAGQPGRPFRVTAVYEAPADPASVARRDYGVRFHLSDLAGLLGRPDAVDRFGVVLRPGVTPDSAAALLNRVAFGYRAYPSREIASEASQTFRVVSRFHDAIGLISVVASAVFLLCIMLLKVEERRRDAALLRFTGVRRRTIFTALLLEALLVAAIGSAAGVGLAYAAGAAVNGYYRRFFDTTLIFSEISPGIVLFGLALSLTLGLGAGAIAAWRLAQTRPMTLWGRG